MTTSVQDSIGHKKSPMTTSVQDSIGDKKPPMTTCVYDYVVDRKPLRYLLDHVYLSVSSPSPLFSFPPSVNQVSSSGILWADRSSSPTFKPGPREANISRRLANQARLCLALDPHPLWPPIDTLSQPMLLGSSYRYRGGQDGDGGCGRHRPG